MFTGEHANATHKIDLDALGNFSIQHNLQLFKLNSGTLSTIQNPIVKINGVVNLKLPPYRVAIHENILIPVGTAMIIVAAVK